MTFRSVALALVASSILPVAAHAAVAFASKDVRVHAGPGTDFRTVGRLHDGDRVDVSRCTTGYSWCEISHRGTDGWVAAQYLYDRRYGKRRPLNHFGFRLDIPALDFKFGVGPKGPEQSQRRHRMGPDRGVPHDGAQCRSPRPQRRCPPPQPHGARLLLYGRQLPRRQLLCACRRERPQAWSPLERSHLVDPRHRRCARARLRGLQLSWPLPCRDARPAEARPARQRRDLVLSGDVILPAARRDERRRRRYIRSCGGCPTRTSGMRRPCRRGRRW